MASLLSRMRALSREVDEHGPLPTRQEARATIARLREIAAEQRQTGRWVKLQPLPGEGFKAEPRRVGISRHIRPSFAYVTSFVIGVAVTIAYNYRTHDDDHLAGSVPSEPRLSGTNETRPLAKNDSPAPEITLAGTAPANGNSPASGGFGLASRTGAPSTTTTTRPPTRSFPSHMFATVISQDGAHFVQIFLLVPESDAATVALQDLQNKFRILQTPQARLQANFGNQGLLFGVPAVAFKTPDEAAEFCRRLATASVACSSGR